MKRKSLINKKLSHKKKKSHIHLENTNKTETERRKPYTDMGKRK